MVFAHAIGLLWALPTVGVILLLYMLRLRRRDVLVPSTLLWRRVIRDVKANAPFQRLRPSLLLYLQVGVVLLLVAAVARPFGRSVARGGHSIAIVVDVSASMGAAEAGGNRMAAARREARRIIDAMAPGDQALIIAASSRPVPVTGFTSDRPQLLAAVADLDALDTGTNMRDAVSLAAAMVASHPAGRIHIVSDGAFGPVADIDVGSAGVSFHRVGRSRGNAGITAIDGRRNLDGDPTVQVFVTVRNAAPTRRRATLTVSHGEDTLDAHAIDLAPDGEASEVFEVPQPSRLMVVTATLDGNDDLAVDDTGYLVVAPRSRIEALLVTRGNRHLETAAQVDPEVRLTVTPPGAASDLARYDAVIFDGVAPRRVPATNCLFANCAPPDGPVHLGDAHANGAVIPALTTHPLLQYVDFGSTRWTSVRGAQPVPWAQEVASCDTGAAVVAGEMGRHREVWTGFSLGLAGGAFPYTVPYPIFVSNAVRWLAHSGSNEATQVRTGAPCHLEAAPTIGSATVTGPDGTRHTVAVGPTGAVFDATDRAGVYTVEGAGGFRRTFAANLADDAETAIAPRDAPGIAAQGVGRAGRPVRVARHLWPWAAGLALGLLGLEWWVFHRRAYLT